MGRILVLWCLAAALYAFSLVYAGERKVGEKCVADIDCEFGAECTDGVCLRKREFDFGGSGKSGKPCSIDADCIGAGRCVEGDFGKKYCSGN